MMTSSSGGSEAHLSSTPKIRSGRGPLDAARNQQQESRNEMPESPLNESSDVAEVRPPQFAPLLKKDIPAFLAYAAEHYPLLIEIFDRVARELIKEGVDLRRLADGDLSVFERQSAKPSSRA
jgi:hypothetical protein